jgi:hypothetical protein
MRPLEVLFLIKPFSALTLVLASYKYQAYRKIIVLF